MQYHDWEEVVSDQSRFLRNLDWNLLKIFLEIVRQGGVTNAARAMSRQQPSLSNALKRLEEYFGVVLCTRGPSGFKLTAHGKIVSSICRKLEENLEELPGHFLDVSKLVDVQIRIATVGNVISEVLDRTLATFCQEYPQVEVIINVAPWHDVERLVLNHDVDIGIAPVTDRDERIRYELVYQEQNAPVCGRGHPMFGKTVNDPSELADLPFATLGDGEFRSVTDYRLAHGWGENCLARSLDPHEVRRMVLGGSCIAMLPQEYLAQDIHEGKLWQLMPSPVETQVDICLMTDETNPNHHAVDLYLDMLTQFNTAQGVEPVVTTKVLGRDSTTAFSSRA